MDKHAATWYNTYIEQDNSFNEKQRIHLQP